MENDGTQNANGRSDGSEEQVSSTQTPHVLKVTWMPDDHVAELTQILQGVDAHSVEKCLVQYVENSIEPTGWRAVWRPSSSTSNSLLTVNETVDYFVDVVNVSREKLMADIKIQNPVQDCMQEKDLNLAEQMKNKEVPVPLMELYPLAEQENNVIDISTTAEVVEQIRFFYKHIWQAWDLEEEKCIYDHYLITARLKLYQDIESGRIPVAIGSEMRSLIKKAKSVHKEILKIESANDGEGFDCEIDQEDVAHLIQLHKQLEQLKARFDLLRDPVFRELSSYQTSAEQFSMMSSVSDSAKVKVVVSPLTASELAKHMQQLPDIIKSLPEVSDDAVCQTFPSFQLALDTAVKSDVVVLLPGTHTFTHLGLISTGGTLIGMGTGVEVCGSSGVGDVMLDTCGTFTLQNMVLKPAPSQVAVVHHTGTLRLNTVTVQGGTGGIVGLGGTQSHVRDLKVQGCRNVGLDFREDARAAIFASTVEECNIGVQVEDGAKVSLVNNKIEGNVRYGVLVVWPRGTDITRFANIDSASLMECMLEEYRGNCVENNQEENLYVMAASSPPRIPLSHGSPTASSGSLDSGFELIENVSG